MTSSSDVHHLQSFFLSLSQLQQLQSDQSSSSINLDMASREIEDAVTAYLRRATETFDLSKNVEVKNIGSLILGSFWTLGQFGRLFYNFGNFGLIWLTFWIFWATLGCCGQLFRWLFYSSAHSLTIILATLTWLYIFLLLQKPLLRSVIYLQEF